jgi:hypothetical protein
MKKDFIKELAELINKHGLEKEMRDTPDYILAQVCVDAMAVFSEAIARRDEWHGFRNADAEKPKEEQKPESKIDCSKCEFRMKCAEYMSKCKISELIENFKKTDDNEEKIMINAVLKDVSNALNRPDENHEKERLKNTCIKELIKQHKGALYMMFWDGAGKYETIAIKYSIKRKNKKGKRK